MSGRLRTLKVAVGVAAAIGATLAVPGAASANAVQQLIDGVDDTVGGLLGGGSGGSGSGGGGQARDPAGASAAEPRAGVPPTYVPPAHGTNPHGQGTGIVIDLAPEDSAPLPYSPGGGSEDVVVGASRGEQNADGSYHGHVTILALFGNELIPGADTGPGETDDGPLGDVNALLADVCTATDLCLSVLETSSQTTETGSSNSFSVARADLALGGAPAVNATAVSSEGSIEEGDGCQTATGSSSVASADLVGVGVADALSSSSESTACSDGSSSQNSDSSGIVALGTPLPLPQPGCEDGTPDTSFNPPVVGLLVSAACNADDTAGSQMELPNGVREALSVFVLPLTGQGLVKVTTAASESQAVAPAAGPDEDGPAGPGGPGLGEERREPEGPAGPGGPRGPAGPGGPSAEAPEELAFTGADVLTLALIGLGVAGTGLALMGLADWRRRPARS